MDCNANQVKKLKLSLEARHSWSLEASKNLRSKLTPRLFIPRVPLKKDIFRKHMSKETISNSIFTKYQKTVNSKNDTHLSDNHNRFKEDENKTVPKIKIRLLQGRPKWRNMENNVTNKKTKTTRNRLKKEEKTVNKIKENTNGIPKNKGTKRKAVKKNSKNLGQLNETSTSQEYSTTDFSYSSSLENSPHKLSKLNRTAALHTRNSNIQFQIPDKTTKELQKYYLNTIEKGKNRTTKKFLNNIDCINLISESDESNSPHQDDEDYNPPENFDAHWEDYCREALKPSHLNESHSCMHFSNVFKNSTKIPEFQSIVRDSISLQNGMSIFDLQIEENLMKLEDSIADYSECLRKSLLDIQGTDMKIKHDLIDIINQNFKSLELRDMRLPQSQVVATSKPSTKVSNSETEMKRLTFNNNSEETVTILIEAEKMPAQTITYKISDLIPPTSCATMESEKNLPTTITEKMHNKNLKKSKVTQRKRRQKTSDKTRLSNNKLQSLDTQNPLPAIDLNQTGHNSLNQQTNRDIVYNQRPLDMPLLGEDSESNCSKTQSLRARIENPNSLASANQVSNQNQTTVNSQLTNFPITPTNYLPATSRAEATTLQQQFTNSNAYSTNFPIPASGIRTHQNAVNSEIPSSICTVVVKKSTSTYIQTQVYENSFRLQNTFNSQVVTNSGYQHQNMYQTQTSQSQQPPPTQAQLFARPYSQPVRNIYNQSNRSTASFNTIAPMDFYHNTNLVPSNYNYQLNNNLLRPREPLTVQQIPNTTIPPPLYNQSVNNNFNTFNNVQAPSADGRRRSKPK